MSGNSPILWKIDKGCIIFVAYNCDERELVESIRSALNCAVDRVKDLIYVQRVNFLFRDWVIPLFIDDEGSAWLELIDNASALDEAAEGLSGSRLFRKMV